jgi:hypothetical protein
VPRLFSSKIPVDFIDQSIVNSTALPSTMAVSTTWPCDDTEGEEHSAATKVTDRVQRRRRSFAHTAEVGQRTGE